jgi:DNA-binding NtrC family response regulator
MKERLKVLVVDDDQRMVKTICDILKVKGYEGVPAYSGEAAVEAVKGHHPDCVLMDIKMPGISGVEALKLIKEVAPELKVVLMSAYATDEQAAEVKQQGGCAILTKPVDFQLVLSFLSIQGKEESILVVDDDPAFCATLRDILQARGYRVATEGEAQGVLAHLDRAYQLLVILDLKLGAASGLDVLGEIRRKYPSKPVVLMTGYREEMGGAVEKGLRIGAYACLYKPFEAEELLGIIAEISREKLHHVLGNPF